MEQLELNLGPDCTLCEKRWSQCYCSTDELSKALARMLIRKRKPSQTHGDQ